MTAASAAWRCWVGGSWGLRSSLASWSCELGSSSSSGTSESLSAVFWYTFHNVNTNSGVASASLLSGTRRYFYLTVANFIFLIHAAFALLVLVGWAIPGLFYIYLPVLITSLVSELLLGYCVLTKWEFGIRKKLNPTVHYEHSCLIHYGRRCLRIRSSDRSSKKSTQCGGFAFTLLLLSSLALSVVYRLFIYG